MDNYKIIICIFGCVHIEKYSKQVETINNTWGLNCKDSVKLLYFLGEEKSNNFTGEKYIYIPKVKDDYISASYKQYLGLKYIYENYKTDFVFVCGTDTFINIPKLLLLLNKYNPTENLFIGGHGGTIELLKDFRQYFHNGGAGFILTKKCLEELYPLIDNLMDDWNYMCNHIFDDRSRYNFCADVSISYYLEHFVKTTTVKIDDLSFLDCNYKGINNDRRGIPWKCHCHGHPVNISNIVTCHNMSLDDFYEFNDILLSNNYFIE
jgi:hypothetical protein